MSSTINNSKKQTKGSKLRRFFKVPIRFLIKARDFYIQSMNQCSVAAGTAMGCPAGQVMSALPRSFSSTSSRNDDHYGALQRVASLNSKIESGHARRMSPATVPRSCSVGVGRIDEDEVCEFGEADVIVTKKSIPRSRSCASSRRARMFQD